jgi:hypothetical protein
MATGRFKLRTQRETMEMPSALFDQRQHCRHEVWLVHNARRESGVATNCDHFVE